MDETPLQNDKKEIPPKTGTGGRKKTAAAPKNAAGTAKKSADTVKKSTDTAKKSTDTVKKTTETAKKSADTTKKTATGRAKKGAADAGKAPAKAPDENSAQQESAFAPSGGDNETVPVRHPPVSGQETAPEHTPGAFPPVVWENTLPEEKNAARMPVSAKENDVPAPAGAGVPAPADGHEVGRAVPPVDFPDRVTKKSIARRVLVLLLTVAVLGAAMFIFFFRPAEYTEKIGSVISVYDEAAGGTAVIVNGKKIGAVGGKIVAEQTDGRGYTAILRTEAGELWLVRNGKMRLVSANVTAAVLAAEGEVLAFRTGDGVLYRCGTGKKDAPQLVSNDVPEGEAFCLSPSGKELLYTSAVGGAVKAELSSMRGSAPYLTDTGNYRPVALADKCRFIYFRDAANTLYIYNAKTARITNCGAYEEGSLVFNRDFSEVFFKNADSCRYYKDGTALTLTGLSGGETLRLLPNQRVAQRENVGGVQLLQKSLLNCYYRYAAVGGNNLVYLTAKKDQVQMALIHSFDEGTATVTDKYVFFLSTDKTQTDARTNLYAVKNGKTAFERLMADVTEFCANVDGSRILYRDAHGPLRAMHMGSSPTQLADGFQAGTLCVTLDDIFYFRTGDGALYRSENGDTPEKVADGVRFAATDAHVAFFLQENGTGCDLFTNYRGRRKNTQVMTMPYVPSDDGETPAE